MRFSRVAGLSSVLALLLAGIPNAVAEAVAQDSGLHTSTKLISTSLPATLKDCGPSTAQSGGRMYTNLWTVQIDVVDLAREKVFTNATGYTMANPRLSVPADHSFHNVIAKSLSTDGPYVWGQVTKFLKLPTVAHPGGRGFTAPAGRKSVPRGHSIIVASSTLFDVSQGFLSDVSKGCNLVGTFTPWVTSAVAVTKTKYSSIVVNSSSLVDGKFTPTGAMALTELKSVVTKSNGSNTGPLPTGFGFPKVQGELFRNDSVVPFTHGGRGSVFVGWSKDELPRSNTLDPFTDNVSRAGSW
jgi:hypothetical protein